MDRCRASDGRVYSSSTQLTHCSVGFFTLPLDHVPPCVGKHALDVVAEPYKGTLCFRTSMDIFCVEFFTVNV